jgi:ubiquinol-cytochrome c reductase cytochrome c subunit
MSWKLGRRRPGEPAGVPAFRRPPGRLRRRLGAAVRLLAALTIVGGLYTAMAPGITRAEDTPPLSTAAEQGKRLYETTCITCHGPQAQGVQGRGPSLLGSGSAAVEFQVGTGRMPMAQQEAQAEEKPPLFTWDQARQIGAYIQALGGGPELPGGELANTDAEALGRGGELFRINCSQCHAFGLGGGALSSGKYAPSLSNVEPRVIYAAMLSGPQNMPVFGDNQLTPDEKRAIIGYIQTLQDDKDPGGFGLARLGPVPEALVIFLIGCVVLVFSTLWIAGKS